MKKILVVEDIELNRELLVQLLEDEYDVVTANDGAAGIEAAEELRPGRLWRLVTLGDEWYAPFQVHA